MVALAVGGRPGNHCGKLMPLYDVQTMLFMNVTTTNNTAFDIYHLGVGGALSLYVFHSSFTRLSLPYPNRSAHEAEVSHNRVGTRTSFSFVRLFFYLQVRGSEGR